MVTVMADETKTPVTDQHRALAQLLLRYFWLRSVMRAADDAWQNKRKIVLLPPPTADYDAAAQILADFEPKSELSLASAESK